MLLHGLGCLLNRGICVDVGWGGSHKLTDPGAQGLTRRMVAQVFSGCFNARGLPRVVADEVWVAFSEFCHCRSRQAQQKGVFHSNHVVA